MVIISISYPSICYIISQFVYEWATLSFYVEGASIKNREAVCGAQVEAAITFLFPS